jgi:PAS domain S-box-containing protein
MSTGSRIMIVEDDEIIVNLISFMLEKKGYTTAAKVSTGEEAVLKSAEVNPDLVLMDINLNGLMDGITAARYIFSLFHIPVLFLTGLFDDTLLERAKASEPYGYLLKPVTEKELVSSIEIALHNHAIHKSFLEKFGLGDPKKTMDSAEAIIITDLKDRIVFFNTSACRLLDQMDNDLIMKPLKNTVQLINGQTSEQLRDPVFEVVRQKIVVSYESNTVLVTKSGKPKPVGVSARPLLDDQNELIGVIIQIREKTVAEAHPPKVQ